MGGECSVKRVHICYLPASLPVFLYCFQLRIIFLRLKSGNACSDQRKGFSTFPGTGSKSRRILVTVYEMLGSEGKAFHLLRSEARHFRRESDADISLYDDEILVWIEHSWRS